MHELIVDLIKLSAEGLTPCRALGITLPDEIVDAIIGRVAVHFDMSAEELDECYNEVYFN